MRSNRKNSRWKLGIASAMGAAALAAPATAPADVNVKVGSTNVGLPVLKCDRTSVGTGDAQTVTVPEIKVPVYVGPIIPDLGAVNVSIGEDDTTVPINGQAIDITVDGDLVNERDAATTPDSEVSGPDAQPVEQSVTLPVSAELVGVTTPADITASSCKQEAQAPSEQPAEEPTTEEPKTEEPTTEPQPEQPQSQPEPQPQPEQPQSQPEPQPQSQPQPEPQSQGTTQAEAPAQQQSTPPASTQQQPASNPQHRPATTGQDKAKKSKAAKKSKKKAKKSKPKRKKSKKSKRNRGR